MADIFSSENARELFRNKFVFMLGDSNMRATYKDLVQLVNRNALLDSNDLRRRGEPTFQGDRRIVHSGMMRGRGYAEGREFLQHEVHIEYHFITRCYTEDIEHFLHRIKDGTMKTPDVFVMNSCLWDISRWGPDGVDAYKENMNKLMMLLKECLPSETLFIWTTTLPVSSQIRGGLLIKQIDFLQDMLRFEVMEANLFCRQLVVSHGYDVLDTHYHLRMQIHRRLKDGLHYGPLPVRFVTNLLLTHISLSWGVPLPGNSQNIALERVIHECVLKVSEKSKEKEIEQLSNQLQPGNSAELKNKIEQVPHHKDFSSRGNRYKRRNHRKNIVQWENRYHNGKNWENPRPESWEGRNEQVWPANHNRSEQWYNPIPPWQKHQQQQQDNTRNQNFWQDTTDHRPGPNGQAGWNNEFKEHYQRSSYANFDRVGGPVPKNKYRLNKRTRPY